MPTQTLHLFPILDQQLLSLLRSLTPEEWNMPTVAKLWTVKDIAAHLLDGNFRGLSISRDGYFGEKAEGINSYQDLVDFLNRLNLSWTNAAKRLSPQVLIALLESSGAAYYEHLKTLDPNAPAIFSVAWAGQETSPNWFHIAREYTEKFLHQQQIRDAVGMPGIMTQALYYPFIDTLMQAFPHTFRNTPAEVGTIVAIEITSDIGGCWRIIRTENAWESCGKGEPHAKVTLDPHTAWKLFSKSWSPAQVQAEITGNEALARQALQMVSVMA